LFGLAGLLKLQEHNSLTEYFREGQLERAQVEELQAQGIGPVALGLILRGVEPDSPPFNTAEAMARLADLSQSLRTYPSVLGVVDAGSLYNDVTTGSPPGSDNPFEGLLGTPEVRHLFSALRTESGSSAHLALLVPMQPYQQLETVFEASIRLAKRAFPECEVSITGRYPLILRAQRTLFRAMVTALAIALLAVVFAFRFVLGYWRLAVFLLFPNLWPVLILLGFLGLFEIKVDSPTLMVGSVILGLAVDDTLHALGYFRRLVQEGKKGAAAAAATLKRTAPAHILTSTVLCLGFAICGFTALVPVARFGVLTAVGILLALGADLVLVPVVLRDSHRLVLARENRLAPH
jgi:predicted RND superfamily exporter protein